jgi:DNA-binding NtrC family response regulator
LSLTCFQSSSTVLASYPQSFMLPRRILAYGEDTLVISTRAMILRRAGYEVIHTTKPAELLPLLRGIFFDLLLVGDSVRMLQNVRLVKRLREQFPELPMVRVQDEKEDHDPWSTAFVSSSPEQMLNAISLVLEEHSRKPVVSESAPQQEKAMHTAAGC